MICQFNVLASSKKLRLTVKTCTQGSSHNADQLAGSGLVLAQIGTESEGEEVAAKQVNPQNTSAPKTKNKTGSSLHEVMLPVVGAVHKIVVTIRIKYEVTSFIDVLENTGSEGEEVAASK